MADDQRPDGLARRSAQMQRLGEHLTADEIDALIERLGIAKERARERHAPQELTIKIRPDASILSVDPTDNYGQSAGRGHDGRR